MASDPTSPKGDVVQLINTHAISVHLPPFWHHDPAIWFAQAEAQFNLRGITQEFTKFYHVIAVLPSEVAAVIRDILKAPDPDRPYQQLREALIQRYTLSEHKRLEQLLSTETLGDCTPSQLLRRLNNTLGDKTIDSQLFTQLFFKRLPTHVQTILAPSLDSVTTEKLATMADKILEVQPVSNSIAQVDRPLISTASVNPLEAQIKSLANQINELRISRSRNSHRYNRSLFHSRSSSRSGCLFRHRSPSRKSNASLCWYHNRFGRQAKKCSPPCSFHSTSVPAHSISGNDEARC